jgi:polysaccharide pyruvyl transferase CsaB
MPSSPDENRNRLPPAGPPAGAAETRQKRTFGRILIAGYYGFHNLGDEAILEGTVSLLSRSGLGPLRVLSGNPAETGARHGIEAVPLGDLKKVEEAIASSDLLLWGGGGLIHDYWGFAPRELFDGTGHAPAVFLRLPWLASLLGVPSVAWAQGFTPPAKEETARALLASLSACSATIVRDEESRTTLRRLGHSGPILELPDAAFALPAVPPSPRGEQRFPVVAVAPRPWPFGPPAWSERVAEGLVLASSRYGARFELLPFQHEPDFAATDDRAFCQTLENRLRSAGVGATVVEPKTPREAIERMASADVVVAQRYHAAIFAAKAGRPMVTLSYDPKVAALARDFTIEACRLELDRFDGESLAAAIGAALANREGLATRASLECRRKAVRLEATAILCRQALDLVGERGAAPPFRRGGAGELPNGFFERVEKLASERQAALEIEIERLRESCWRAEEAGTAARLRADRAEENLAEAKGRIDDLEADLPRRHEELRNAIENGEAWQLAAGSARKEVEDWKAAHDNTQAVVESLRAEIGRWRASRLGRLSSFHWKIRRWLGAKSRRFFGRPTPAVPVGPRLPVSPTPKGDPLRFSASPAGRYDLVVFSIIDWNFRFQRPQQIATQFGRAGHRVLYLSTTKFLPLGGPAAEIEPVAPGVAELRIRSRRGLDIYGGRLEAVDLDELLKSFEELALDQTIAEAVSMVEIPFWAPLAERLRAKLGWKIVYDCMDEWTNFPGFGPDVLALEEGLVEGADLVSVSAERLEAKWRSRTKRLLLARNGVDLEHYRRLYLPNDLLRDVARPVVGYYGALASWIDVPLLLRLAEAHPEATFVLAGGRFDVDLSPIENLPNVRLLGQRPYDEMPQLLWGFDVCIIPFLVNDITEATNPVKFYEYCYSGKPVVSPLLTELRPFADVCYLGRGHDDLVAKVGEALREREEDPRRSRRRRIAEENDWRRRCEAIDAGVREAWPLVSVVIVTWGGLELTRNCIDSLLGSETWPRLEVVVVDNASPDRTREYLESVALGDRRIRPIFNSENRGFAAANNVGIAAARGEIVVLLNNDTVVPPGLVGRLVRHLETDPSIGVVCPTTNFCGNEARIDPGYTDFSELPGFAARRARSQAGRAFDIEVAAMYCIAARRSLFERVGTLDEEFGVGMFEDDDFALRVRKEGFRVVCAEDAYVHHVGQGSFSRLSAREYNELWSRNQAYFEKKWGRPWHPHRPREGVSGSASKIGRDTPPATNGPSGKA